jgi:prepilin-type processing-associated H-X9-DG protein/prepilin-type N-terminal cleavage/methylation domain-containing protein
MRNLRAFTLVELLVVLGIVSLLAGLVLTVTSSVRQAAASAACLSNLRQMAVAATDYAMRNHGSYPPAQWNDPSEPVAREWDFAKRGTEVVGPGFLWAPQPVTAVQQCSAFDGKSRSPGDLFTGYNYNTSYIGRGKGELAPAPARVAQVRRPSRTVIFGDGQAGAGANKYMRSPLRSPSEEPVGYATGSTARAAGTQGFRHRGATNAAFCDGHAESLKDRTDGGNSNVAHGAGFLLDPDRPQDPNSLYDLD